MFRLRQRHRFNRVVFLALALLVSNIATMSCAMAYALCGDCPEHVPVLCVESCATAEAAISDSSPDTNPDTFRTVALTKSLSLVDLPLNNGHDPVAEYTSPDPNASPPLHLQYCVFLK